MRIEWSKASTRVSCWEEQVQLLVEEMRRIPEFFRWEAKCWDERGCSFSAIDPTLLEGHRAYALRQASIRRALAVTCHTSWADTLAFVKRIDEEYLAEVTSHEEGGREDMEIDNRLGCVGAS